MTLNPELLISMKRIEIVVDEESLRELTRLFREAKVQGYTIIKGAGGLGSRGGSGIRMTTFSRTKMQLW